MGRHATTKLCAMDGCTKIGNRDGRCPTHSMEWYRKQKHLRCEYGGCNNLLREASSPRTLGRRMSHGGPSLAYCREHEWHHLTFTKDVHALNWARLGAALNHGSEDNADCWIYTGKKTYGKKSYGLFVPEGAGDKNWMAHRVAWNLLFGGHGRKQVLDHICRNTLCCNPLHLQPVSRFVNSNRRGDEAMEPLMEHGTHDVFQFAKEFSLPLPDAGTYGLAA